MGLFHRNTVESITSDIHRIADRLIAHADWSLKRASEHSDKVTFHQNEQARHLIEKTTAQVVATKLRGLVT